MKKKSANRVQYRCSLDDVDKLALMEPPVRIKGESDLVFGMRQQLYDKFQGVEIDYRYVTDDVLDILRLEFGKLKSEESQRLRALRASHKPEERPDIHEPGYGTPEGNAATRAFVRRALTEMLVSVRGVDISREAIESMPLEKQIVFLERTQWAVGLAIRLMDAQTPSAIQNLR